MRALVVDDSSAIRAVLRLTLRQAGFEVVEARNGKDALSKVEENSQFDLALVDWNMPEMNGMEFLTAVRKIAACDPMRIMMVTTETEIAGVSQALNQGANEYVMKPFTKEVILEKLSLLGLGN